MYKILLIEDNLNLARELKTILQKYGYQAMALEEFSDVMGAFHREQPHLVILDMNLPVFDGFHFCREIRNVSNIPIICVTSRNSSMDEVMGITLGADDYITKPYHTEVLLARVNALIRRHYTNPVAVETLRAGALSLNLATGTAAFGEKTVDLPKNSVKILHCLIREAGQTVSREKLMEFLWESDFFVDDNTLTVNVNRLRKSLESLGTKNLIETKKGQGYLLHTEGELQ